MVDPPDTALRPLQPGVWELSSFILQIACQPVKTRQINEMDVWRERGLWHLIQVGQENEQKARASQDGTVCFPANFSKTAWTDGLARSLLSRLCEERSDEAISLFRRISKNEIASLRSQ
jgi:hypothetical protein